ncbi:MAG: ribosome recycling factor [bacterium]
MVYDFTKFKNKAKEIEEWLKKEFGNLRTNRATPTILDGVKVESYGAFLSLQEVANISTEDARCIRISPWDHSQTKGIEKAIVSANLGVSVTVDDKGVRVIFPELTGERRTEIVKMAKARLEEGKINVRKHRDEVMKDLQAKEKAGGYGKDDINRFKNDLQKLVDEVNKKLEDAFAKKEKEITN